MNHSKLRALAICLPIGLGLSLAAAACGGSDSGNNDKTGGSATTTSGGSATTSGGTSASTAGTGTVSGGSTGNGGSSASSGGDFMTGLPASTPLSSLTDAQSMQLCSSLESYLGPSLKDIDCRLAGVLAAAFPPAATDADAQAACKSAYDMCNAASATSTGTCTKPTGTCTATVSELEKCITDEGALVDQAGMSFPSCADLTLKDLMGSGGAATQSMDPASCTTLQMKCPDAPIPSMTTP